MILCGLWHNTEAQAQAGLEQYYYMGTYKTLLLVPVAYYQTNTNWYAEARYNYEAANAFSMYYGKSFEKDAALSYSICPVLGFVLGGMNGASVGLNLETAYKKLAFSTQSQYTISVDKRSNSFVYSWSDLTYQLSEKFAAGVSLQQTKLYHINNVLESGILIKAGFRSFSFPLYIFNPTTTNRYFVLGINYEWQKKSMIKTASTKLN